MIVNLIAQGPTDEVLNANLMNPFKFYQELIAPDDFVVDHSYYHELWNEIHTKENPTQEWFDDLIKRVPNIQCGCLEWLRAYVVRCRPQFDNWSEYSWTLHNAVNVKLSKPEFSWAEFELKYPPAQANPAGIAPTGLSGCAGGF